MPNAVYSSYLRTALVTRAWMNSSKWAPRCTFCRRVKMNEYMSPNVRNHMQTHPRVIVCVRDGVNLYARACRFLSVSKNWAFAWRFCGQRKRSPLPPLWTREIEKNERERHRGRKDESMMSVGFAALQRAASNNCRDYNPWPAASHLYADINTLLRPHL